MQLRVGPRGLVPLAYLALAVIGGVLTAAVAARAEESPKAPAPTAAAGPAAKKPAPKPEAPKEPSAKPAAPAGEAEQPTKPLAASGPREMLRQFGIDDSRFEHFRNGRPLQGGEVETLLRILYRLDDFPMEDIDRWIHKELDLAGLAKDPNPLRGEIFPVRGRVVHVDIEHPVPEVVERFDMPVYYRCEMELDPSKRKAVVFTRTIPKAWEKGGDMDQRAGAAGFFLKLGSEEAQGPVPVFAARRVAWYPDTPLGDIGFDVGLLDDVMDKESLRGQEREAFYQLLWCVGRTEPGQLRKEARQRLRDVEKEFRNDPNKIADEIESDTDSNSVVPLFLNTAQRRGRLVVVSGEARKVVLVRVDDPDIRARFGIDHYYELSVFTPDSQGNPLVFCVRDLPKGMPVAEKGQYSETVRVAGFLLKMWAYRVPAPPGTPESQRESTLWTKRAPLLIARAPLWYPRQATSSTTLWGAIAGALFLVALLATWAAIWRYNRADRKFHEKTIARNFAADSGISLDSIGLDADGKPDFSSLDEAEPSEGNGKRG